MQRGAVGSRRRGGQRIVDPREVSDALFASPVAFELKAPVLLTDDNGDYLLKTKRVLASCSTIAQVLVARGTTVFSGVTEGFMQAVTLTGGVSVPAGHMDYAAMLETSIGNYHSKYVTLMPFDVTNSSCMATRHRIPLSRAPTLSRNTEAIKMVTLS